MRIKKLCNFFRLTFIFVCVCCVSMPVSAFTKLSEDKLKFFGANNILYYDPTGNKCKSESNGVFIGTQYNLTDEEIKGFARMAVSENSCSTEAIKTELSLMANLYEQKNRSESISQYVQRKPGAPEYGWFSTWDRFKDTDEPSSEAVAAVKEVLIDGKRNLPPQVVEHDCIGGINGCTNKISNDNGITWETVTTSDGDKNKFRKDQTWIKTIDGSSHYVFYRWAGGDSKCGDPFGYYENNPPEESYSTMSGYNQNYAGEAVWTDAELQAIEENRAIYEEAANAEGFPWQVMATLHSAETGLRRYNPSNGQGVYQLYSYTGGGTNANRFEPADSISEEEFRRQTRIAAGIVKGMVGDLNDPDNVKRLFFQYNGVAQVYIQKALNMGFSEEQARNGEGSAYVMNRFDAQRDPASSSMSPYWPGRFVGDGNYDPNSVSMNFGTFVKYAALGGMGGGTCSDMGLRSGGMTLEEANEFMHEYTQINYRDWDVNDAGCSGGPLANCVAFSQYFINRYTSAHFSNLTNGSGVVALLLGSDKGFVDGGTTPRAYAIFSVPSGSMYCGAVKCGHTGVVLGIDTTNNKIIIGEAGCSTSLSWADYAHEYDLDKFTDKDYTFAYTDDILNLNGN